MVAETSRIRVWRWAADFDNGVRFWVDATGIHEATYDAHCLMATARDEQCRKHGQLGSLCPRLVRVQREDVVK